MVNKESRVQKKYRARPVESRIEMVVTALNGEFRGGPDAAGYRLRPLLLLVKRMQDFATCWDAAPQAFFEKRQAGSDFRPWSQLASEKLGPVLRLLDKYQAKPTLEFALPANDQFQMFWDLSWDGFGTQFERSWEIRIALEVIEIARVGRIDSLKQCEDCNKWLFAKFPHQRFCSTECKEQFHTTNEADKARRREWARANYQARKELELGSRKAAQRRGGKK